MPYNKQQAAEYYQKNKELIKRKRKQARRNEPAAKRTARLAFHKEYNARPENRRVRKQRQQTDKYKYLYGYKRPAKKRGYEFTLSFEEFVAVLHGVCYLCGDSEAGGIDRINNSIGYILRNCAPCCEMCNKLKWAHDLEPFLEQVRKIHENNRVV